jgi:serine/threonine protein kinase
MSVAHGPDSPASQALLANLEEVIAAFEQAWQQGERPSIDAHLDSAGAGRLILLRELVHADLECRLKAGEAARVEDYLQRYPELIHQPELVFDMVAAEFRFRHRLEAQLRAEDYCQRFPAYGLELTKRLQDALAQEDPPMLVGPIRLFRGPGKSSAVSADSAAFPKKLSLESSIGTAAVQDWPEVPGFTILGELGRGNMGVVYKAHQNNLKRLVALKMILAGSHVAPEDLVRFRGEAEAVARLQHPNVVQIYEIGESRGYPYLALEYVEGASLAHKLAGNPQPAREAATLVLALARAIHAAHLRGIIHRDLKPENILLQIANCKLQNENLPGDNLQFAICNLQFAIPKITDFGLAKQMDRAPGQTQTGAILGTPCYMAPEQAEAKSAAIGPAADVYALGVILYEILTGRPPFKGATTLDTLRQVIGEEPVPPSRLQSRLPRDLETICLKCLQKAPARRYGSADALAGDLERFLAGEPIRAKPVGSWERLIKWIKRRPAVAALAGVTLLAALVLTGLIVGLMYNERLQAALKDAQKERDKANQLRSHAQELQQRIRYAMDMNIAHDAWHDGAIALALEVLAKWVSAVKDQRDLRNWEWYYLQSLCSAKARDGTNHPEARTLRGHTGPVGWVVFSPDSRLLASAGGEGAVTIWNAATGLAVRTMKAHEKPVTCLAFRTDGKQLASASMDATVKIWDVATGKGVHILHGHVGWVWGVAFSPDGRRLASAGADKTVHIWNARTGKQERTLKGHVNWVSSLAFSADGKRLASASGDRTVKIWDTARWKVIRSLLGHATPVSCVTFSPDGKTLASGGGGTGKGELLLWDLSSGVAATTVPDSRRVTSVAYSPDGRRLLSGGFDRKVKLWDVKTGLKLLTLSCHLRAVTKAAFSPDGRRIASSSMDTTVKLWDAQPH